MNNFDAFDDLMDRWEEQFAQGKELSPEELCREHPQFLEPARKYIFAIKAVGDGAANPTITRQKKAEAPKKTHFPDVPGYEILDELGRGGMGIVYRARQKSLKRLVALKMVLREDLASKDEILRFRGEAEALGQLQHPNIVQVYDVGESGGHPYFALELVAGGSLNNRLRGVPLPIREAAEVILTLAQAVHFAHEHGFIHRDLKPGNILLGSAGEPKITDFGLAKRWNAAGTPNDSPVKTASGEVLGTPAYMAPEQARGEVRDIGPAVDIYALGAMLYELLTGQLPFRGMSLLDVLDQVCNSAPMRPSRFQHGIPRDLETICLKCLDKTPARRYLTAKLLAEDLQRFLDGKPILARPITLPIRFGRWCRRNPFLAGTSIAAILALLTTAVVSVTFAIESEHSRKDLQASRDKVQEALTTSETHRRESLRRLTESSLDRGLALCEQGEIVQGMWWLVRALDSTEELDDLKFVIEANLAAWSNQLCALEQILEHPQPVAAVSISADNRLLATAIPGENRVHFWSLPTGEPSSLELKHGDQEVTSLAFHPSKPILATAGKDHQMCIWQIGNDAKLLHSFPTKINVDSLRFSNDGRWLGVRIKSTLSLIDADANFHFGKNVDPSLNVSDFTFLYRNPVLLTADFEKRALRFWNYETGKPSEPIPVLETLNNPLVVAASPDGSFFASGGTGRQPTLYKAETRHPLATLSASHDLVYSLAFHPQSSHLLIGGLSGLNGTARMWNPQGLRPYGSSMAHGVGVLTRALFTPDGLRVVTSASDRTTRIWRLPADPELRSFPSEGALPVAISPDGRRFISLTDQSASIWDVQTGKAVGEPLRVSASKARFDHPGRWVLLCGVEKQIRLWDVTTGQLSAFEPTHDGAVISDAVFTPEGDRLITGGLDGTIRIWDRSQEKLALPALQHGEQVTRLLLNFQGTRLLAFGSVQGKARITLWDSTKGERILDFQPETIIEAAAFSPDGKWLATSGKDDGKIRLWDPASGADLGMLEGHALAVNKLTFDPVSGLLASASNDGTARLWRVDQKELVGALRHPREVLGVAFSQDGRTLLTHCIFEGRVSIWDVATLRQIGPPRLAFNGRYGHSAASFAGDGQSFLLADDTAVRLFAVPASRHLGREAWTNSMRARTGQELDAGGAFRVLGSAEWRRAAAVAPVDK